MFRRYQKLPVLVSFVQTTQDCYCNL